MFMILRPTILFIHSITVFLLFSCASTPDLPPPPPRYVHGHDRQDRPTTNSLWRETANLYEDVKARRLNDLVTIRVSETITGTGTGSTNAKRDSSLSATVDQFFGAPINLSSTNSTFVPKVTGAMTDDFKGSADTSRKGTMIGTITAKVVDVFPNGNLYLESRKEITVSNEKQTLVLRGIIRPEDIGIDNVVLSEKVADAEIYFVGKGVIQDKQSPGWFSRILDKTWPF